MKKMITEKKFPVLLILLFAIILTGSSCSKKLMEQNFLFKKVSKTMLIAGDGSDFKDKVRGEVIQAYKNEYNFDIVNIDKLKTIDSLKYDLIIIMDTTMAWGGFNPSFKNFLDCSHNKKKTVLFMTASDPDWQYSYKGIDAVTSASYVENIDTAFAKIKKEIEAIKLKL